MKTAQKLSSIKQSEIFESFSAVELGRLLGILEEMELPKHHVIFSPGMPSDAIFFIEKGRIRLTKLSGEGKTVILALLGPGDLIGWCKGCHMLAGSPDRISRRYLGHLV